ncbi:hypothetical protein BH09PAT2_BH09PAT2_10220 [soil metagenome]
MNTTNKKVDPFKNLVLDEYEQSIEESLEKEEWVLVKNQEESKKMFEEAAKNHIELRQSKKITFRINQGDLIKLKAKAVKKNIPYQTLLGALVRDFVDGEYVVKL